MRELIIMFLQGMLYIVVLLYIAFASRELYKEYTNKPVSEPQQEEQPIPTNQQPMYILSPRKES